MNTRMLRQVAIGLMLAVLVATGTVVWWLTADHAPRTQLEADLRAAEAQLKADPTDTVAAERLGVSYMRAGRYRDALDLWDSALEAHPDDPVFLFHRGEALIGLAREDDAIESLKHATEEAPNLQVAFYTLAQVHAKREEWDQAASYAASAVEIERTDADARFLYATALSETGDADAAREQLEIVKSMIPEYPGIEEALDAL